jgi:hypothetical protein
MGFFSGIKDMNKKVEAAVIVQNLLEIQVNAGTFSSDPQNFATRLVNMAWDKKPDLFNGGFGQRPFKLAVAASAFSNGVTQFNDDPSIKVALVISLGNIFLELQTNRRLYPLNSLDDQLLEDALVVFKENMKKMSETPLAEGFRSLLQEP